MSIYSVCKRKICIKFQNYPQILKLVGERKTKSTTGFFLTKRIKIGVEFQKLYVYTCMYIFTHAHRKDGEGTYKFFRPISRASSMPNMCTLFTILNQGLDNYVFIFLSSNHGSFIWTKARYIIVCSTNKWAANQLTKQLILPGTPNHLLRKYPVNILHPLAIPQN